MKNKTALIIGGVIVFIILLAIIGGSGSSNNPSQTTSSNNQPSLCSDVASLKNQATAVDFKELDKNPDSFQGKIAKFTGQILEIQESGNQGVLRLAVTKESYGWSSSDVVYVEYQNHTDAVQDDKNDERPRRIHRHRECPIRHRASLQKMDSATRPKTWRCNPDARSAARWRGKGANG